jgi:ABC-type polysaccharide transport system permease subunit
MTLSSKKETISRIILLFFTDHDFKFRPILCGILNKLIYTFLKLRIRWRRNRRWGRIIIRSMKRWRYKVRR